MARDSVLGGKLPSIPRTIAKSCHTPDSIPPRSELRQGPKRWTHQSVRRDPQPRRKRLANARVDARGQALVRCSRPKPATAGEVDIALDAWRRGTA